MLATRDQHGVSILIWNYHDDDVAGEDAAVTLSVDGLPDGSKRVLEKHFRIDASHSNAYSAWKAMGSPQAPTMDQQRNLVEAGQLQMLESPNWLWNQSGSVSINFNLPRQGVSLIRLDW